MRLTFWALACVLLLGVLGAQAVPAPVIYQLSRDTVWHLGGTPITIRGENLLGTSKVTIGGLAVTSLVVTDSTVTFMSPVQVPSPVTNPAVAYAMVDLVLTAPGGTIIMPKAILFNPPAGTGVTAKGSDWAVLAEAVVTANPPAITLKWPLETRATGYAISRKLRTKNSWTPVGTAAGNTTSWTDTVVAVGQAYEYRVQRTTTIMAYPASWGRKMLTPLTSYGYVYAGIDMPSVDHRGTVILIVDKTIAGPCSAELALLQEDIIGDGWSVIRHDVARGTVNIDKGPGAYEPTGAPAVKQLIVNDYQQNPGDVKSVLLFGHVPVPYSGNFSPAGHADGHRGAMPADVYYGDVDGVWTDNVVNAEIADAKSYYFTSWNVPGDGKFDQSWIPSDVELEVGRVDLSSMGANEVALLKQYITKTHNHRYALTVLPRRTLIMEGSGDDWNGLSQGGWRSWSPLVGAGNLDSGWFYPKLVTNKEAYLGLCVTGSGDNGRVGSGDRTTTVYSRDFTNADIKVAFCTTWGSHHGDWDHPQNLLRAPLTSSSSGLTNVYGYFPSGYMHTMGLGGTVGEAIRLKQNNTATYAQYDPGNSGGVHIALMGDPTLRLFAVSPPSALTITKDGKDHPVLAWQASTDNALLGYYVYRGSNPNGPFLRVTPDPITKTNWTDGRVASGTVIYQVKAAKLETTPSGSYINTSQALTVTITVPGANEVIPATPPVAYHGPGTIYQVSPVTINEGNDGISKMTITCLRVGGSTGRVVVKYVVGPDDVWIGLVLIQAIPTIDYELAQGTLTWDDGDMTPKTFTINVKGNLKPEYDKFIPIQYSVTEGSATVQHPQSSHNYVINDDGAVPATN